MKCEPAVIVLSCSLAVTSPGFSAESEYLRGETEDVASRLSESEFLGLRPERAELNRVALAYSEPGWDGFDAEPVHHASYLFAERLLALLPACQLRPTILADVGGNVVFEWYHDPHHTFSISVSSDGVLHYAALLGQAERYGSEPFLGTVPAPILSLIEVMESMSV